MSHEIKNSGLNKIRNRGIVAGFSEVEDETVRPSKHHIFPEERQQPKDLKPPARDQDRSVSNLIPDQDYDEIIMRTQRGSLFEDRYFNKALNKSGIEWLRPHQISKDPEFIVGERDRFDVNQGELGNCWFLSALANLAENKKCFDRVVPSDQDFKHNYKGIFRFRFFRLNICHII